MKEVTFEDVPLDITLKILERLNGHELGIAECVSKLWMGAISSSELWQRKCKEELSITIKRTAQAAVGAHATPQTFREAFALVAAHLKLRKVGLKGDPQEVPMRMMRAFCRVREIWGPPGNQMPELEERMLPGLPHEQLIGRKSDRRLAQAYGGMLDVVTTPSKNIDTLSEARFLSALLLRCTEPHRVPADHASEHLPRKRGPESSSPEASAPGNDTSTAPEEGPQHVTQGAADAGGPRDPEEAREEVGGTSGDGEDTSSDREGGPSAGEDFRSMIASMGPNVREIRPGGLTMYVVGSGPSGDPCEEREEGMAGPLKLGSRGVEANELYWVYTACGGDRADEESLAKQTRQDSAETWPETADIALKGFFGGVVCYENLVVMSLLPPHTIPLCGAARFLQFHAQVEDGNPGLLPVVGFVSQDSKGTTVRIAYHKRILDLVPFSQDHSTGFDVSPLGPPHKTYLYDRNGGGVFALVARPVGGFPSARRVPVLVQATPPCRYPLTSWIERWSWKVASGVMRPVKIMESIGRDAGLPPGVASIRGPSMMPSLPYQPGARPPPVVWTDGAGPGEHEWDGLEVVRCVSEGVEVTVSTLLMPEEVVLRGSGVHFVWTYRVEMRLLDREGQLASGARKARDQVQLLSREWAIEDSSGAEVGRVACGEWVDGWTPGVCADVRPCFVS